MRPARDVKGELARIEPARECCREAEVAGLRFADDAIRTLDPSTARIAVRLGAGRAVPQSTDRGSGTRHHLALVSSSGRETWSWAKAAACDHRAFLRGVVLGSGSLSFSRTGPHVEFVFRDAARARTLRRRLKASEIHASSYERRGRAVVYVKGRENVASLLHLTGAHGALLELEAEQVGHDVQNRLNRLLNAEAANVNRTVHAAERQVRAIDRLEAEGRLDELSPGLRLVADARRAHPEADLEALATELDLGRSAVHHRLRRIEQLAG
ncbi:MAG TPA: DNA-binding protein WhiA [Candidatus Limnocylindria bacterium]|nr:DNA-binding protein WhiA [Candidatus Limnocylindria bacterium]